MGLWEKLFDHPSKLNSKLIRVSDVVLKYWYRSKIVLYNGIQGSLYIIFNFLSLCHRISIILMTPCIWIGCRQFYLACGFLHQINDYMSQNRRGDAWSVHESRSPNKHHQRAIDICHDCWGRCIMPAVVWLHVGIILWRWWGWRRLLIHHVVD